MKKKLWNQAVDRTGQRIGKLVAIKPTNKRSFTSVVWEFKCDCGNTVEGVYQRLRRRTTPSCGCAKLQRFEKHGMTDTPIYNRWRAMTTNSVRLQRRNHEHYPDNGKILSGWDTFSTFYDDMGESFVEGSLLMRRERHGPYSKENCYWADVADLPKREQCKRLFPTLHGYMTIDQASKFYRISRSTLLSRRLSSKDPRYIYGKPVRGIDYDG